MRRGAALNEVNARRPRQRRRVRSQRPWASRPDPIELDAPDGELVVTPDVSFPVEVQRGDALADQLRKLNQLLTQGILTEDGVRDRQGQAPQLTTLL